MNALPTHDVTNQSSPLRDVNLYAGNRALQDALRSHLGGFDAAALSALGARCGSSEMQDHARLANVHTPRLLTHDRQGRRIDRVEFHPSYHALMAFAVESGLHGTPWAGAANDHGKSRIVRAPILAGVPEARPSYFSTRAETMRSPTSSSSRTSPPVRSSPKIV